MIKVSCNKGEVKLNLKKGNALDASCIIASLVHSMKEQLKLNDKEIKEAVKLCLDNMKHTDNER